MNPTQPKDAEMDEKSFKERLANAAMNACAVRDNEGGWVQDHWAYDRFKAGANWSKKYYEAILSEERARLWKAIELAIQDGAKYIGGAAGAAFSETSPSVYVEKAKIKSQPTEDKRGVEK